MKLVLGTSLIVSFLFGLTPSIFSTEKMQKYATYYMNIGKIYANEGKYKDAIWFYRRALLISPHWDSAYCNMGLAYYHIDKVSKALKMCRKAIYSNPKNVELYKYLGMLYNDMKEYFMAYKAYSKALEIDPKDLDSLIYLGDFFSVIKGDYEKASKYYSKAIEVNPRDYRPYFHLAYAHIDKKEFDIAIELLKMAIKLNPADDQVYHTLFELEVVENREFDKELEKSFIKRFKNNKEDLAIYEMLKVLKEISQGKKISLKEWAKKYKNIHIPQTWDFRLLEEWVDQLPEGEIKLKLTKAIYFFKDYKGDS